MIVATPEAVAEPGCVGADDGDTGIETLTAHEPDKNTSTWSVMHGSVRSH